MTDTNNGALERLEKALRRLSMQIRADKEARLTPSTVQEQAHDAIQEALDLLREGRSIIQTEGTTADARDWLKRVG